MQEVENKIIEHNYDGIQEYDNPLPRWWVWLFIITVIWGVAYIFYYHLTSMGDLQEKEYASEFKMSSEEYEKIAVKMNKMWANVVFEVDNEPASIEAGKAIFQKNCISCHGAAGGGGIGPNLTDEYFLHGGGIKNTMSTIINGVQEKGMISWKSQLKPEEIRKVASYILSISGSNPPNGKAPQGTVWEE